MITRIGFLLVFFTSTLVFGRGTETPRDAGVVKINFGLLASRAEAGFALDGFSELRMIPQDVREYQSLGVQSVRGKLSDGGSFVIASEPDGTHGVLWTAAGTWELSGAGDIDAHGMLLLNAAMVDGPDAECSGVLTPSLIGAEGDGVVENGSMRGGADPQDVVRVLVVFDPFAAADVGGVNAYAAALVASANQAYENSGVNPMRLELVGAETIDAVTSSNSSELLRRLTNRYDGNHDIVHPLREAYDADLVALIVDIPSFCGQAWIRPTDDHYGFSLSDTDCALGNLTFAHELGHNIGCSHDTDNAGTSFLPYGFGHRWNNNLWRSVMAYSPGSRVPYFSNPLVSFDGAPTGLANEHDNARVINIMDITIANMRTGNGSSPDCNANSVPDRIEIALEPMLDLDRDAQLDACQINADPDLDCNNDGILDSEQVSEQVRIDLGAAQPFGAGQPVFLTSPPLVQPDTDVTIIIAAEGDLGASSESVLLDFNGGSLLFQAYATTGIDCYSPGILQEFTVPASMFSTIAAEGVLLVVTSSAAVNPTLCTSETNLRVAIEYRANNTGFDADIDGIIDSCAPSCAADLTDDGGLDIFDVLAFLDAFNAMDPVADFTGDGGFNIFDLLAFLDAFNAGCP